MVALPIPTIFLARGEQGVKLCAQPIAFSSTREKWPPACPHYAESDRIAVEAASRHENSYYQRLMTQYQTCSCLRKQDQRCNESFATSAGASSPSAPKKRCAPGAVDSYKLDRATTVCFLNFPQSLVHRLTDFFVNLE